MRLSELRRGDRFRVIRVTLGGEIGRRLVDMGLCRGVEGVFVRCAILGDPVQVRIQDCNLSLRLAEAAGIELEILERGPHRRHWHGPAQGRQGWGAGTRRRGGPHRHGSGHDGEAP